MSWNTIQGIEWKTGLMFLTSRSNEKSQTKRQILESWETKRIKLNKKTIIPKTLQDFNLKAIYDTMQYSH